MSSLAPLPVTPPAARERVAYLDNARYWVMLLVVIGHCLTDLVVMDSARGVYTWIYAFHMPLFILISGYTARHYVGDLRQIRRLVSTLVVPYLIVELSLQLITRHYDGEPERLMVLSPQWVGWFMAALIIWRLTTPIWRALKYPITVSIVISLASGLIEIPNALALHKTIAFLPFYVIGLHLDREMFERLAQWRIRVVSAVVLGTTFVASQLWATPELAPWLLWRIRYADLDAGPVEGVLMRAALILVGLALTAAALSLVPWGRSWTTAQGERTFYCYLLHGFVIIGLDRQFDLWARIEPYGAPAVLGCMVAGAVLANLLMTAPVARTFRPVFEPRLTWLFRDASESPRIKIPT
ncbi:acyltransferase [Aeromicrobium marinum DSM 15272]|uniref:Acyltransferase n=1 Tax=Aeromicrobium marinum DSM 15272 TaxID=585531 RepID=E2SGA3_9ACTN|nr:acyltransferase family protein [Aeromicrobium marinum]EFQ81860.1 acyltransferase [Aeromicrobium marinum DSM 15272]